MTIRNIDSFQVDIKFLDKNDHNHDAFVFALLLHSFFFLVSNDPRGVSQNISIRIGYI